ncbi:pentatricopeptide repeat-containing protein At1g34160 [Solanum pennellii]|uniref:Pentatricopeptide repeat-containing protein At1g34160 n=1 Tax=Solanum pennellii TaxID=28526 RepID=A0ABM1GKF7_SOLPN|nr:pentatricopeptide repeat-containing protein At1g34160 [Solanum pennellii]
MAYVDSLLSKCTCFSKLKQLQAHLIITGNFQFYTCRAKFLDFCAVSSAGNLPYATHIFRHITSPFKNEWNAIIRGLAQSHKPIDALTFYVSMSRSLCKPDALTCSFTLKACARALARSETPQLHTHVIRFGFAADVLLRTTLLDAYSKCGDLDYAYKVFDEMGVRDIASWNALIAGLAQGNRPTEALLLFKKMREEDMEPNEVTVLGALSACSQLGANKEGELVHEYIKSKNLDCKVIVCNAVIDMYAKCGVVGRAYEVFSEMKCLRTRVTWNTMIMALAMYGDGEQALELFERMGQAGIDPDSVSYLAAICACNHAGMVEEGMKLFDDMDRCGVSKNAKHYGSMVDLLGRAGRLEEAYKIVQSMPTFPDVVLWQTLLGASKTYGNVEMAEIASKKLVEMGSNHCGDFVLLSNLYAAQGRWHDVRRVREAMKGQDVKKVPGFSYIEVGGTIYKFMNGDKNHPKWNEIYWKLDEVSLRIREYGYVAETNYVFHDIGPEEKENALCYHSEKLAVAFGLISTPDRTCISVNKNLRICGDCHVVIKLISKIYEREIIVRDRTRFHRFKDGACSCKEYW